MADTNKITLAHLKMVMNTIKEYHDQNEANFSLAYDSSTGILKLMHGNREISSTTISSTASGGTGGNVDLSNYVTKETGNASQITFADGKTFQEKLDTGTLQGPKGDIGPQGPAGADAATPNFTFAINMIASNETAYVTTTGTYPNLVITFNIPQGTGSSGSEEYIKYDESTKTITI